MSRKVLFPAPKKKFHRDTWEIYWNWNYKRYSLFPGFSNREDESVVESELRQLAAIFAASPPVIPGKWATAPGLLGYLKDRYPAEGGAGIPPGLRPVIDRSWLRDYEGNIRQECTQSWATVSLNMLQRLDGFVPGGIIKTTSRHAGGFLDAILKKGRSIATRNRTLAACSRFFKWAVATGRMEGNPFSGLKTLKEPDIEEIVYCTREERDRLVQLARDSNAPDWMAVPIAFYAGMRRGEIFDMLWRDVLLRERRIVVPKSKTKKRRVVPIAGELLDLLGSVPESERSGYVVKTPNSEADRLNQASDLVNRLRAAADGTKADKIPAERIGWNAWRHTFGSLLAQSGVSLDKISSWMGNTPDICRRHYAQFVPRDSHDDDIDKL